MTGKEYYCQTMANHRRKKPWELVSPEIQRVYENLAQAHSSENSVTHKQLAKGPNSGTRTTALT